MDQSSTVAENDTSRGAGPARRVCAWCEGPMPARARRDAITCTKRCRQARHRVAAAARDASPVASPSSVARRFAYADPPYPGNARLYRDHPDYAGEVDHAELLSRLATYDGWALSTSARALPEVLALAVAEGLAPRVAAWIRQPRPHATARYAINSWEPVIYVPVALAGRRDRTDVLVHGVSPMHALPGRVIGAKPAAFCRWMFNLVGATPNDTLDDLFPGSGIVTRAWEFYTGSN